VQKMRRRRSAIWKMVTLLKGEDKGRVAYYFAIPVVKKHGTRECPRRTAYGADVMTSIQEVQKCARLCKCLGEYQEQHQTCSSVTWTQWSGRTDMYH
jgi:hypothetical protein